MLLSCACAADKVFAPKNPIRRTSCVGENKRKYSLYRFRFHLKGWSGWVTIYCQSAVCISKNMQGRTRNTKPWQNSGGTNKNPTFRSCWRPIAQKWSVSNLAARQKDLTSVSHQQRYANAMLSKWLFCAGKVDAPENLFWAPSSTIVLVMCKPVPRTR